MSSKTSKIRWGLHASILAIAVVFIITGSVAYPKPWNQAVDYIGWGPKFSEEGQRLGLDLQGGTQLVYEADMSDIPAADRASALDGVRDVIERRVNAFGVSEPSIVTNMSGGKYRIIIELAGVFDVTEAIKLIGETPILEFKVPNENVDVAATQEQKDEVAAAQKTERTNALDVLKKALAGDDFKQLVRDYSIDSATQVKDGYFGFIDDTNSEFGALATKIKKEKLKPGVIEDLYESTSKLYAVNYMSEGQAENVETSHILICYKGASNCTQERSKEDALALIQQLNGSLTTENFAQTAKDNSDCPSAAQGGDLGVVKKGMMVTKFEDALFAMKDGTISDVVETEFGYHLIYRRATTITPTYEISYIEMPWTTLSDIMVVDPWVNTGLSGKHLKSASVAFDNQTGQPYVSIVFNSEGGELFGTLTEENVNKIIGIFLDGQPISTPVVQQAIYGGEAMITGDFTTEEAKLLAQRLNSGALPVSVELLSEQTVGPTLGQLSFDKSLYAAMIGFLLVGLFMIAYYRLPGILSVVALLIYAALNLAVYKWLGVTLTLAGIAGFILSLGMAVDANVLIFERMKEELGSGRDLATAIDEGFKRAWTSIRDGNLTTLIAAAVLFIISTSFIKGFAITLGLGVSISMISAIIVTRLLLKWVTGWRLFKAKWLYGSTKID